jgi:hypothetical protein
MAPALISISVHSDHGISVPEHITREGLDFLSRLVMLRMSDLRAKQIVTVRGVFIRRGLPIFLRNRSGDWFDLRGHEPDRPIAELVATSSPVEDSH